jgi:hypothetical protein
MAVCCNLPNELWAIIFSLCTNVPGLLDTSSLPPTEDDPRSWSVDLHNIDWGTKRSSVLVSRLWRSLALPYFYEHLLITRKQDLPKLARTLVQDTSVSFSSGIAGQYVRRIDVRINFEMGWTKHYLKSLTTICEACPTILVFRHHDYPGQPNAICATPGAALSALMKHTSSNENRRSTLRDLQLWSSSTLSFRQTLEDLQSFGTMQVLRFCQGLDHFVLSDAILLPLLHTLHIRYFRPDPLLFSVRNWILPRLVRIDIIHLRQEYIGGSIQAFLEVHGSGITVLEINSPVYIRSLTLATHLPLLKKLILHSNSLTPVDTRSHPKLSHICIQAITRGDTGIWLVLGSLMQIIHLTNLPGLQVIRFDGINPGGLRCVKELDLPRQFVAWLELLRAHAVRFEGPGGDPIWPEE